MHRQTVQWISKSREAGHSWVVANDEQGSAGNGIPPDGVASGPSRAELRHKVHATLRVLAAVKLSAQHCQASLVAVGMCSYQLPGRCVCIFSQPWNG